MFSDHCGQTSDKNTFAYYLRQYFCYLGPDLKSCCQQLMDDSAVAPTLFILNGEALAANKNGFGKEFGYEISGLADNFAIMHDTKHKKIQVVVNNS